MGRMMPNFNPRPPRGGRLYPPGDGSGPSCISIHALREEGDPEAGQIAPKRQNFNPRPPRGGRPCQRVTRTSAAKFQSTPSARRATVLKSPVVLSVLFQSTPSARRATNPSRSSGRTQSISIHALREEGDSKSSEKIHHFCSIIHACAQFEKELYEGSGEMKDKSC